MPFLKSCLALKTFEIIMLLLDFFKWCMSSFSSISLTTVIMAMFATLCFSSLSKRNFTDSNLLIVPRMKLFLANAIFQDQHQPMMIYLIKRIKIGRKITSRKFSVLESVKKGQTKDLTPSSFRVLSLNPKQIPSISMKQGISSKTHANGNPGIHFQKDELRK